MILYILRLMNLEMCSPDIQAVQCQIGHEKDMDLSSETGLRCHDVYVLCAAVLPSEVTIHLKG